MLTLSPLWYGFPSESSFPALQGVRRVVLDVKKSVDEVMERRVSSLYLQIPRTACLLEAKRQQTVSG